MTELGCSYPEIFPLDTGVVSIRLSNEIQTPGLAGWLNPVILLPADIKSWTNEDERVSILRHEFAHVKRNDHLAGLFQSILKALFFFHPVVRYACNQLSLERDLACDDQVLGLGTEPSAYAESILKAIERSFLADVVHQTTSFATRRKLEKRIDMILDTNRVMRPLKQWRFLLLPSLMTITVVTLVLPAPGRATNRATNASVKQVVPITPAPVLSGIDQDLPVVDKGIIWVDEVKRGEMQLQVRGLGYLASDGGEKLKARVILPVAAMNDVELGQPAATVVSGGTIGGKVYRKYGIREDGATFQVDLPLDGELPAGAQDGTNVDATIQVGRLDDVLYVGRPVVAGINSTLSVFKINDGNTASRVTVKFGNASINNIQILDGLQVGDKVILSDMSQFDGFNSVRLK
ncbi:MAG TPA: M56 family metallopeptidase [Blastocatellia bacterium]|nr:M56 family metallopeptidase [Blastocatellia bacterium]